MKLKLPAVLITVFFSFLLKAQTFTASGDSIYDYATTTYTTTVTGLSPSTIDTNFFGLETVCIDLRHTWDADLEIYIVAPDGTRAMLTAGQGGSDDNYTNTCFNISAATSIAQGSAPFTGTFQPIGQMGRVNNGQNGNGVWTLSITDTYPADDGRLFTWSITFGNNPATYIPFVSSNLPIVVINTNNQIIVNDPKIMADMGVIWNGSARNYMTDPFNHYNGKIGIELRGASSQGMPKKPYGIELWDVNGNAIDSSMFGMPKENDWILTANYADKSLLNNTLSYQLARDMGWYAPRTQHVELVINGEYVGNYVFTEKIKRDNDRVDIAKLQLTDISGDELSGGYIIKVDRQNSPGWVSNYPASTGGQVFIQYVYPDGDDIVPQQQTYIQNYVDSFETALNGPNFSNPLTGYARFIDVNSFVDYFILNEFSKNVDGYRLSTFLYKRKDSDGGKLFIGPAWDYDLGWHNADYCDAFLTNGWAYNTSIVCPGGEDVPFWWARLVQDTAFTNKVQCRWQELRQTIFSQQYLYNYCDSMALYLNESQHRNFLVWPILGSYVWPNPSPIPANYAGEITELKLWIQQRGTWLDNNLPGNQNCNLTGISQTEMLQVSAFPNPFSSSIQFTLNVTPAEPVQAMLVNSLGQTVHIQQFAQGTTSQLYTVAVPENLSAGVYLLRVSVGNMGWTQQVVKTE
ncbi:MAG: CotH kinase family protein [Bacteroidia bacterium]